MSSDSKFDLNGGLWTPKIRTECSGLPVLAGDFDHADGGLRDEFSKGAADGEDGALGFVKGAAG